MTTRSGLIWVGLGRDQQSHAIGWIEALVSLVMTVNLGTVIERLDGIDTGHRELLDWIDQWISR